MILLARSRASSSYFESIYIDSVLAGSLLKLGFELSAKRPPNILSSSKAIGQNNNKNKIKVINTGSNICDICLHSGWTRSITIVAFIEVLWKSE
jgi:hypothetical protein